MTEEKKSPEEVAEDYKEVGKNQAGAQLPLIDFSMFIFSLNSSALAHMGVLDDPTTGTRAKNLPAARQTIDILSMIEEKTRGNLTRQEDEMLRHMLYDLRMKYVKESG